MMNSLIGTKQGQTQLFDKDGKRTPVTLVSTGPCRVVQIKNIDTDGYWAVQLGLGNRKEHTIKKPQQGHYKKAGLTEQKPRFLREIRVSEEQIADLKPGMELQVGKTFRVGDEVMVTGTSKGKGFAGVIKRWGFHGGPKTHGQSDRHRAPGSIGAGSTPGRVLRGKKMAGRMGSDTVTVKGLTIMAVDKDTNTVTISGLVPGPKGGLLYVTKTKDSPFPPEEDEKEKTNEDIQEANKQDTNKAQDTNSNNQTDNEGVKILQEDKNESQEKSEETKTDEKDMEDQEKKQETEESKEEKKDTQETNNQDADNDETTNENQEDSTDKAVKTDDSKKD